MPWAGRSHCRPRGSSWTSTSGRWLARLRLVGVDTAYANDLDDDVLIERANAERRCGKVYWRGAHSGRLEDIVASAIRAAGA